MGEIIGEGMPKEHAQDTHLHSVNDGANVYAPTVHTRLAHGDHERSLGIPTLGNFRTPRPYRKVSVVF